MKQLCYASITTLDLVSPNSIRTEVVVAFKDEIWYEDTVTTYNMDSRYQCKSYKDLLLELCIKFVKEKPEVDGVMIYINEYDLSYHAQELYELGMEIGLINKEDPLNPITIEIATYYPENEFEVMN